MRQLKQYVKSSLRPDIAVQEVFTDPRMSRLVSSWPRRKGQTETKKHFKQAVSITSRRRGAASLTRRQQKWEKADRNAISGLTNLKWKWIRRIVGIEQWGEKLL
ncbi:hypothetical protein PI124_g19474 [Phytophthora idaei]|nr:hypothetical protein PI125_g20262 [Phytophthora idaei]KAG3133941.1 hypothetical protein PI126_g18930 [Phytophthora idaei]KAG3235485.1 hypothetical protein PI124_g19474 [Phytophthora idaei]